MTIVYILGSGHCGSTLLDMLLNGHSQIQGLGEAGRRTGTPSLLQMTAVKLGINKNPRLVNYASNHLKYINCIARITNKSILVDSSKFWQRLHLISGVTDTLKVIHLTRDGRGVTYSYDKKYNRFFYGLRRWLSPTLAAIFLKKRFSRSDWIQIRYEDLSADPETELQKICSFLNVEFESEMLKFRKHYYSGRGGNRMRKLSTDKIKTDASWQAKLTLKKKLLFAIFGGWLNKYYRYPIF